MYNKAIMLIEEHPAILVLISAMGFVFSCNASVLWEDLAPSVIVGLMTLFVPEAFASHLCEGHF